jgi:DNA ligase (NAD+)
MNIEGLGEKIIEDLIQFGWVKRPLDLYDLAKFKTQWIGKDGYQQKLVDNVLTAIEHSKQRSLEKLIFALGITQIGEKAAKMLAIRFQTLQALSQATTETLLSIPDFGPKMSEAVIAFFALPEHVNLVEHITHLGINTNYLGKAPIQDSFFSGKTIVITGSFSAFSRDELTELLEARQAKVVGSVSKQTNLVIVGEDAGSKAKKAELLKIDVINETQLLEKLNLEKV